MSTSRKGNSGGKSHAKGKAAATRARSTKRPRAFRPHNALAKSVAFDEHMMHVHLMDGRIISVPLGWSPILRRATPEQRQKVEIGGGGVGLHWSDLDEDLSVAGLLAGAEKASP